MAARQGGSGRQAAIRSLVDERRAEAADGRYFSYSGQKGTILERIASLIPGNARRLIEPFAGSGVVAQALAFRFEEVVCSDALPAVAAAHRRASSDPDGFVRDIEAHFEACLGEEPKAAFARTRDEYDSPATTDDRRAVLLIYLGAKSFSHLIRHNSEGGFSASWHGGKAGTPPPRDAIFRFARNLAGKARFTNRDFREVLPEAGAGDFVYCDPPYMPLDGAATNFEGYAGSFGPEAHADLARLASEAAGRGAKVVVSNHDSAGVRRVYAAADDFLPLMVERRVGNRAGAGRSRAAEVLIVFRPASAGMAKPAGGRRRRPRREAALDRFGDSARLEDLLAAAFAIARDSGFARAGTAGDTVRSLNESGRCLIAAVRNGTPSLRRLLLAKPERARFLSLALAARLASMAAESPADRVRAEALALRWERLCSGLEEALDGTPGADGLMERALRTKAADLISSRLDLDGLPARYAKALGSLRAAGAGRNSEEGGRLLLLAEICPAGERAAFTRICSALGRHGSARPVLAAFPPVKKGAGRGVGEAGLEPLEDGRMSGIARDVSAEIRRKG